MQVDKVEYIEYIKQSPNKDIRNAETALLCGNFQDAEAVLLQSNQIFRAIMLNLYQYNWDRYVWWKRGWHDFENETTNMVLFFLLEKINKRALELAIKHQNYMDIVIGFRQRFLEEYEKPEKNKLFLKYRKEVSLSVCIN